MTMYIIYAISDPWAHERCFHILTMKSRECNGLDLSYQRYIIFAYIGYYQLYPHHHLGIITLTSPVSSLERMDTLVS